MTHYEYLEIVDKFEKMLMEKAGVDKPFPLVTFAVPGYEDGDERGGEIYMGANLDPDQAFHLVKYYLDHKERHEEKARL